MVASSIDTSEPSYTSGSSLSRVKLNPNRHRLTKHPEYELEEDRVIIAVRTPTPKISGRSPSTLQGEKPSHETKW